jgi:TM2 domain-containing membrane protein YozV
MSGPERHERTSDPRVGSGRRLICGLTAIFLPGLGVHKFLLGMPTPGLIMLAVTVSSASLGWCLLVPIAAVIAMAGISIVEGLSYLTKSDEEFERTYVVGRREWF